MAGEIGLKIARRASRPTISPCTGRILLRVDAKGWNFRTSEVRALYAADDSHLRLLAQIRGTEDAFPLRRAPRRGIYYDSSPNRALMNPEPQCNEIDNRDHQAFQAR